MFQQLVGQTLDAYKILDILGEGGMGAVLKGYDVTLQREVAIKVMHTHIAKQANFQERFLQEARTAARLDHPSIVQVYSFGQYRSMPYIVMKYIPGDNLQQMLQGLKADGKWVLLNEAVQITRQVGQALHYAHQHGVLHRDMKPSNIMIEPTPGDGLPYRPVITDLGLAKLMEGGMNTQDGTSMGTPAYMSPEQALGKATDPRSDVYSLGILLYELATGQLPFPIHTLTEAIQYHTRQPPPLPTSVRPELPAQLQAIILKAIEKDPPKRYQTAGDLAEDLARLQLSQQPAAPTALESAVSLITQYQKSLANPRGPSILNEFKTPSNLTRDVVQVLTPDQRVRGVYLKPDGLTIGRDADNDIVLEDQQASRHHARVQVDGDRVSIIDLNSTNGTYLANNRLLPGIIEPWSEERAVRIGQTWLRLRRSAQVGQTRVNAASGTQVYDGSVQSSLPGSDVNITIGAGAITVEPGQSTQIPVSLQNQGLTVDHFQVNLAGVPTTWLPEPPKVVQMMPGDQKDITLTIHPPRSTQSRAGRHPAKLIVASGENPAQVIEIPLTLTLAPFSAFSTELFPQKVRSGKASRLTIKNNGNTQEIYSLDWSDRADEIGFTPAKIDLRIPEGQTGSATFYARPRQTRLIGGEQSHPYTVRITSASSEQQVQQGEVITHALIPAWVLPLLLALCLILASAAGGLAVFNNNRIASASATAASANTAVAGIAAGTRAALTQIAIQLLNASSATQQAATQNAMIQGTAGAASTQAAGVIQTATSAAQELQNSATSTALASAAAATQTVMASAAETQTLEAMGTATAAAATATAAVQSAAQTQTASALSAQIVPFLKTWVAVNPNGGMTHLIIQNVADNELSFHGYGQCTPNECDWGVIQVPFTPPTLQGKWSFGFKTTDISASLSGDQLNVTTVDKYNGGQPDHAAHYVFETQDAHNQAISKLTGTWNNPGGDMPKLIISKVDDFTLSFHGFGQCTPTLCDWGVINVPYTPPTLQGKWTFSFKTTTLTAALNGNKLDVTTLDKYNDSRPNRSANDTFTR